MTLLLFSNMQNCLQRMVEAHFGSVGELRERVREGESEPVMAAAALLDEHFPGVMREMMASEESSAFYSLAFADSLFQTRIKQLVLEWMVSEPLHPPICLFPAGWEETGKFLASQEAVQVIVVEYLAHAANEVYPLMVDGYVHDLERYGRPARKLAMVHESWLDEDLGVRRAMYFDPERDALIERELQEPAKVGGVLFLCISPAAHRRLSEKVERLGIRQVNPYPAAEGADDKFLCYQRWIEQGVLTPPAYRILRKETREERLDAELRDGFLHLFPSKTETGAIILMLQPLHGTEGRGTRAFAGLGQWKTLIESQPELLIHARAVLQQDDLLMRVGVGNAQWIESENGPAVSFDLRFNVIGGQAESGYLMAAQKGAFVSSPGQGGRVVEWKNGPVWTIRTPEGIRVLSLRSPEGRGIVEMAERAAVCYPECHTVGVDIRLEWNRATQSWMPWVLDLNPRPAGLAHSRYIEQDEPGVTMGLWNIFSGDEFHP